MGRICLKENVIVPAFCEFLAADEIVGRPCTTGRYVAIEPLIEETEGLILARSVTDTVGRVVQLRFVNMMASPVELDKGRPVAEICVMLGV